MKLRLYGNYFAGHGGVNRGRYRSRRVTDFLSHFHIIADGDEWSAGRTDVLSHGYHNKGRGRYAADFFSGSRVFKIVRMQIAKKRF
jgi:hypothetical protein